MRANRPQIQVSYTGGTIGMIPSPHGMVPGADIRDFLADVVSANSLDIGVNIHEFDHLIDSANATPVDWQAMVDNIRAGAGDYDGFVILHGTDTLAYTGAALSYALTGFGKPVVITGAQRSINEPGSDALGNVLGALMAASSGKFNSVGVFFDDVLLAGPRATKLSAVGFHGFDSPNAEPLAHGGDRWRWTDVPPAGAGWPDPKPYTRRDVLVAQLVPGITAARLRAMATPAPEALQVRAYGTGDGPSEEPGFFDLIAELVRAGTPVVVSSQCVQARVDLVRYEAAEFFHRAGAIGSGDMTTEAAYVKLVFLLSQGVAPLDMGKWMHTDLAGELRARS